MGAEEVERILTYLAAKRRVSASTQNQAFSALLFLYRDVLHLPLGDVDALRALRNRRIPVVLTREEVAALLAALDGLPTHEPYGLMARLLYGAGLRLMECCRLRLKDIGQPPVADFGCVTRRRRCVVSAKRLKENAIGLSERRQGKSE
jgi:integrase